MATRIVVDCSTGETVEEDLPADEGPGDDVVAAVLADEERTTARVERMAVLRSKGADKMNAQERNEAIDLLLGRTT